MKKRKAYFAFQGIISFLAAIVLLAGTLFAPLINISIDDCTDASYADIISESITAVMSLEQEKGVLTAENQKQYLSYITALKMPISNSSNESDDTSDDTSDASNDTPTDISNNANTPDDMDEKMAGLYLEILAVKEILRLYPSISDDPEKYQLYNSKLEDARSELSKLLKQADIKFEDKESLYSFSYSIFDYALNSVKAFNFLSLINSYERIAYYQNLASRYPDSSSSYKANIQKIQNELAKNKENYVGCLNDVSYGVARYYYNHVAEKSGHSSVDSPEGLYELYSNFSTHQESQILNYFCVFLALIVLVINTIVAVIFLLIKVIKGLTLLGDKNKFFAYGVAGFPGALRILTVSNIFACVLFSFAFGKASLTIWFIGLVLFAAVIMIVNFIGGRMRSLDKESSNALNISQILSVGIIISSVVAVLLLGSSGVIRALLSNPGAFAFLRNYNGTVTMMLLSFIFVLVSMAILLLLFVATSATKVFMTSFEDYGKNLKKSLKPNAYNVMLAFSIPAAVFAIVSIAPYLFLGVVPSQFMLSYIIIIALLVVTLALQIIGKVLMKKLAPSVDFERMKTLVNSAQYIETENVEVISENNISPDAETSTECNIENNVEINNETKAKNNTENNIENNIDNNEEDKAEEIIENENKTPEA